MLFCLAVNRSKWSENEETVARHQTPPLGFFLPSDLILQFLSQYFSILGPKMDVQGYVKSLVYADKPQTLDYLEDNIRRVIADIRPQMLEKVIENWTSRLDYIRASRGSSMPEVIFKM
ncbi:hypothetical protein TNCV_4132791 [Trichonephila clavipes]|nr:hypothetical protein TNCV_4132791 [Trichonephila clavipes]